MTRTGSQQPAGVLFDLDDTLFDHRGAARDALARWAVAVGVTDPLDVLEPRWIQLESTYYRRYQAGELSRLEQRRARVRDFLSLLPSDDAAADIAFNNYWEAYKSSWRAFDDARGALVEAQAAGLAVGILTNGYLEDQRRKVEATGLEDLDVPLIASSELPAAKPDPRAFEAACDILEVAPSRCVMVGDSIESDMRGAESAGLLPILLDRYDRHQGVSFTRVRSLQEVARLLG